MGLVLRGGAGSRNFVAQWLGRRVGFGQYGLELRRLSKMPTALGRK
jgi:hypothetical protein